MVYRKKVIMMRRKKMVVNSQRPIPINPGMYLMPR